MKWKLLTSFPLHSPGSYHGKNTGGSNDLYIQHTQNWQFTCFPFNKDHLVKQDSGEQCMHRGRSLSLNLKLKCPHCKLHIKLDSLSFHRPHPFLFSPLFRNALYKVAKSHIASDVIARINTLPSKSPLFCSTEVRAATSHRTSDLVLLVNSHS